MAEFKLSYFNIRGRAEPLRLCLAAAGKKFEDNRLTGEQWAANKAKAPFGQMPFIEYKGKIYGESKALCSFVARECGLAGKTSADNLRVDEVICLASGLLEAIAKVVFTKDEAEKAKLEKELQEEKIPKYLGFFEKMLKESGSGYFVGKALSMADLCVQDITFSLLKKNPKVLDSFPEIKKMIKNVEGNRNVKAYLDSRPATDM